MKKVSIEITCPKEHAGWTLTVEKDMPESWDEWKAEMGEDACLQSLTRYTIIRAQDLGRRLKSGGKNGHSAPNAQIEKAVKEFKLGVRAQITRQVTPEQAKNMLSTLPKEELLKYIAELQKEAAKR